MREAQNPGSAALEHFQARLFSADGPDQGVDFENLASIAVDDNRLLWIDLCGIGSTLLPEIARAVGLDDAGLSGWNEGTIPALGKWDRSFWLRVVAINEQGDHEDVRGTVLTLIGSPNIVISLHDRPLAFIEEFRAREEGGSMVGVLSAESFVASLLDWQLSTYFDAVAAFEMEVERLEIKILDEKSGACLPQLRRLRRWASRLRRMLVPHRVVYAALARPDFLPEATGNSSRHFEALDNRFERAMDTIENARELVLGSFSLFSSQTALRTNDFMRMLTFVTVITGALATLVGALGMNFDAAFFQTKDVGFWVSVTLLGGLTALAIVLARWKKWF